REESRSVHVVAARRLGGRGRVHAAADLAVALAERFDRDDALALLDVHEPHALRVAPGLADLADPRPQRLAAIGHQHDRIAGTDHRHTDDGPVPVARVDEDDALAAAALEPEFLERG